MKTYIIQLEAHDDLVSARDKLAWAKARRVILIWPKTGKVLSDYYSLSLLKREADRQGVNISFITKSDGVRENARLLGVPVFASVNKAEHRPWQTLHKRKIEHKLLAGYDGLIEQRDQLHPPYKPSRMKEFGRIVIFIVTLIAVLGLGMFFYPSAVVTIFPQRADQKMTLAVNVNPSISEVSLSGVIPGRKTTLELSGTKTGTSTGVVRMGVTKSSGVLTVTKLTDKDLVIPKGTQFSAVAPDNRTFLATNEVSLAGTANESGNVQVEAEVAGEEMNVLAGMSFKPQAAWAGDVSVTNAEPISGGSSLDSPAATNEDYDAIRKQQLTELKTQATRSITQNTTGDSVLISQSLEGGVLVSEIQSVKPGTPSDHFTLDVKVVFTALTYSQSDLDFLVNSILNANLKPGLKSIENSLSLKTISEVVKQSNGTYSWTIEAVRQVGPQLSSNELIERLVSTPVGDVQSILAQQVELRKPSEVTLKPRWWTRMPFVSFRITLEEK
jgi:hypothetical protein